MTSRRVVALLAAALVFYLVLVVQRGAWLIRDGRPATVAFGIGVLLLPLAGVWFLWHELRFGLAAERLSREYAASPGDQDGPLDPDGPDGLPRRPGGRPDRRAADAAFARVRAEVEAAPEDWRCWYRLAVAYADARDTRRARPAMRRAIALHRSRPM